MLYRTLSTTLLQIFCVIIFNIKVIAKSIIDPEDNLWRNSLSINGLMYSSVRRPRGNTMKGNEGAQGRILYRCDNTQSRQTSGLQLDTESDEKEAWPASFIRWGKWSSPPRPGRHVPFHLLARKLAQLVPQTSPLLPPNDHKHDAD